MEEMKGRIKNVAPFQAPEKTPKELFEESRRRGGHPQRMLKFAIKETQFLLDGCLEILEKTGDFMGTVGALSNVPDYMDTFLLTPDDIQQHVENVCANCKAAPTCPTLAIFRE